MAFQRRLRLLLLVTAAAMGVIWLRVVQLQVLEHGEWVESARAYRLRKAFREAPRGRVLDRDGAVLVHDQAVFRLTLSAWDWERRARVRCSSCGAVHTYRLGGRPPRRCPCHDPAATLEPMPLPDYGALEARLGLPPGRLALLAVARVEEVHRLVRDTEARLRQEGMPEFLLEDALDLREADLLQRPWPLPVDVPEDAVSLVELDEDRTYHGFAVRTELRRVEPYDDLAPQLLGFTGVVHDAGELAAAEARYPGRITLDTRLGRAGLEAAHDRWLLGYPGWEQQERDDDGRFHGTGVEQLPVRGADLHTALTVGACRAAERVLYEEGEKGDKRLGYHPRTRPSGGFVAMYADTGEIVAWGEMPRFRASEVADLFQKDLPDARFDPALQQWQPDGPLPGDLSETVWREELSEPVHVLRSRVMQVAVEPGSTLKPLVGLALLTSGVPFPYEGDHPFVCGGHSALHPGCHNHGPVGFEGGIETSCNRLFALTLRDTDGWPIYRRHVPAELQRLGLGRPTGVDVQGENPGRWLQDWYDFAPAAPLEAAVEAARIRSQGSGVLVRGEVRGRVPDRVAGRDPGRLVTALGALLEWGVAAARPEAGAAPGEPGRVLLRLGGAEREDRWVHLRFDLLVAPAETAAERPPALGEVGKAVRSVGGRLEAYEPSPGVRGLALTLTYSRAIGRGPSDPPVILRDDGRNVAIGQGPVTVTPLQMVRAVATLANGGVLVTPHVVTSVDGAPVPPTLVPLGLDERAIARVRAGMRAVVVGSEGTARRETWYEVPAAVYGKTGTAQVGTWWKPADPEDGDVWHHWFVGWAEAPGMPTVAFACVLHARTEGAASLTAVGACHDWLRWWFTEGPDVGLR